MKSTIKGPLADSIDSYLAHKHSLGKQLDSAGLMLHVLDNYLNTQEIVEAHQITSAHLAGFVASRHRNSARSYNELIGTIRGLLNWMVVHELLPESPLKCETRQVPPPRRPFLFDSDQARRIFEVAERLPSTSRAQNRGGIYRMIFVLLYGLGLRVGEVSRLCRKDIDLDNQLLMIRQTKFGKDRLVPFGPRMGLAIAEFLDREGARFGPIPPDGAVFTFDKPKRTPIGTNAITWTFHKLLPGLQLTVPSGVAPPHLHCLRHSFAVGTLLRWYRAGVDPRSRLLDLSTFLGHVSLSSTAVYLTITTELLQCASERFERFALNSRKEHLQ
ncbi:MAG: tyrosine-type recombinase/integrase [Candidatus Sulfotelmatobacter sp.]